MYVRPVGVNARAFASSRPAIIHCVNDNVSPAGVIDEADAVLLRQAFEQKMKRLENLEPCLEPPDPETLLHNVTWVENASAEEKREIARCAQVRGRP